MMRLNKAAPYPGMVEHYQILITGGSQYRKNGRLSALCLPGYWVIGAESGPSLKGPLGKEPVFYTRIDYDIADDELRGV